MPPLWLLIALGGCSDCDTRDPIDTPVPGMRGELGNGTFFYTCIADSDPVCRQEPERFPECIALEGSFQLEFEPSSGPDASVSSFDDSFFATLGGSEFEARRAGTSELIAIRGDEVVDYLTLEIVEPDDLEIRHAVTQSASSTVLLRTGARALFDVIPVSQICAPIGGSLALQAWSSDPSIVSTAIRNGVELFGESPGEAIVTIEAAAISRTLTVKVSDPPKRHPPDKEDSGTGTGTGTETDTGTGTTDTATSDGGGTMTTETGTGTGTETGSAGSGSTTTGTP